MTQNHATRGDLELVAPARLLAFVVFVIALAGQMTFERFGLANPFLIPERLFGVLATFVIFIPIALLVGRGRPPTPGVGLRRQVWLFLSLLLLSYFWSAPSPGLNDALVDICCMLGLVALGILGTRWNPRAFAHSFIWWTAATGVLYALVGLASVGATGRVSVFGGGPNVYGRVCALGVIACLYLATQRGQQRWLWFALPITLAGTVLSGSRGALLSLVVAMAVCGWRLMGDGPKRRVRRVLAVTALCGVGAVLLQERLRPIIENRFIRLTFQDRYDSGRAEPYRQAFRIFQENPIVGSGLHGFEAGYGYLIGFAYPHNLTLQVAAELGVIGLVVLLSVTVSSIRFLRRPIQQDPLLQAIASCALLVFVASQFSGDYYDGRFGWIYLVVAGALVGSTDEAGSRGSLPYTSRPDDVPASRRQRAARGRPPVAPGLRRSG